MIQIMREFAFNIAHLTNKNLHGHSYKLNIIATGVFASDERKIVDFGDFVEFVQTNMVTKLNHAFLFNKNTKDTCEKDIARTLTQNGRKVVTLEFNPTTEKLAEFIFKTLNLECIMQEKDFRIAKLELYESHDCCAIIKG